MPSSCTERLVYAESDDGIALAGAVIEPVGGPSHSIGIVWIHGNTGTFYDHPYVLVGRELAALGFAFITGNTRGHDISATLWRMPEDTPVAGGSAWELIEESPRDLAAWVTLAAGPDAGRVVLIGHSQGAAKAILYQAERRDPRVVGVVAASPDLHGHWPPEMVTIARSLVAAGRGAELLPPLMDAHWYRLSAQNVANRASILARVYASEEGAPFIARIGTPLLALFGQRDVGGETELAIIRRNARAAPRVDTAIVAGADHVYTGQEKQVARVIGRWVAGL